MDEMQKYKRQEIAAKETPEWFEIAQEVMRAWGSGEMALGHAIMDALVAAHTMGLAGQRPVESEPSRRVRAELDGLLKGKPPKTPPTMVAIPPARVSRRAVVPEPEVDAPAPVKRFSRRAV